jgi:rod shape-determining protein MreD
VNESLAWPSAVTIAVVYASVFRDGFGALLTAFVLGLLSSALVGGTGGPTLLALLPVVLVTLGVRSRLQLQSLWGAVSWVIPMSLLFDLGFVATMAVFESSSHVGARFVVQAPVTALLSGLVALPWFAMLTRVEPILRDQQDRTGLLRT